MNFEQELCDGIVLLAQEKGIDVNELIGQALDLLRGLRNGSWEKV
ncbi:hypothetical protein [Anaerosolibacter sp.]